MGNKSRLKKLTDKERAALQEALDKAKLIPYAKLDEHIKKTTGLFQGDYYLFSYKVENIGLINAQCFYDGETPNVRVSVNLIKPRLLSLMFPPSMDAIVLAPKK